MSTPTWLIWAREMQAISQTGLAFSHSEFDTQRYRRLSELAAEIVSHHTKLKSDNLAQSFLAHPGYATPKIDVRGAVIRNNKILLVQERTDERWCLPGGWADVGESPSEAVAREVFEESGFKVTPSKVVAVLDANRSGRPIEFFHAYKIIFLCKIAGGAAKSSVETLDVSFFEFDSLPPLSENRTNRNHIAEVMSHIGDKNRPAAFD